MPRIKSSNLVHQFLPDKLQSEELSLFLFKYFGESSSRSAYPDKSANEIIYSDQLRVIWGQENKQRVIQEIYPLEEVDDSLMTTLASQARKALSTNQGTVISRFVLFADKAVNGYFRFSDDFQISPIPDDWNDQEDYAGPGSRPFILQFSTQKSTINEINSHRQLKRVNEIILHLNGLLSGCFSKNNIQKNWILIPTENNEDLGSKYLYHGYMAGSENRPYDSKGFISPESLNPIEQMSADSYYAYPREPQVIADRSGIRRIPTQVPRDLARSLEIYHSMNARAKKKFLSAAHWKKSSYQTSSISQTLSIFCLFVAIDSLLPNARQKGNCEECNRPLQEGQTKVFAEFLEKYAYQSSSKLRKELYKIRSGLAHGSLLVAQDLNETHVVQPDSKTSATLREMRVLVHQSLVNWLRDHERND